MAKQSSSARSPKAALFRGGKVRVVRRGRVWYLCYHENGKRHQPRVGPKKDEARQMAAEIKAQLEVGAPSVLGLQPISIAELRQRWLDHHMYRAGLRAAPLPQRLRAAASQLLRAAAPASGHARRPTANCGRRSITRPGTPAR